MLPKKQRVQKDLFPDHKTPKQSVSGALFSISYTSGDKPARISCVVSKKVSNSAVVRNTVRRRVYEVVRPLISPKSTGIIIVYAKKPIGTAKFTTLRGELVALLSKTSFVFDKTPRS
jgi:ribonuclease P protein component